MFAPCDIDISYTEYRGHVYEILNESDLHNVNSIVVVSGDGLVHEVYNYLCN